mgnify:CR=1 FL=1
MALYALEYSDGLPGRHRDDRFLARTSGHEPWAEALALALDVHRIDLDRFFVCSCFLLIILFHLHNCLRILMDT